MEIRPFIKEIVAGVKMEYKTGMSVEANFNTYEKPKYSHIGNIYIYVKTLEVYIEFKKVYI